MALLQKGKPFAILGQCLAMFLPFPRFMPQFWGPTTVAHQLGPFLETASGRHGIRQIAGRFCLGRKFVQDQLPGFCLKIYTSPLTPHLPGLGFRRENLSDLKVQFIPGKGFMNEMSFLVQFAIVSHDICGIA